ncbi:MAG TPA: PKD domain-containing protein [Ohtaekwangia sp.]|nr:PKD domain-containing protein [Ohtaekwangia sp.]
MRTLVICGFLFYGLSALADPQPALRFIENKGQWKDNVHYSVRVPGGRMMVETGRFRYYFLDEQRLEALHDRGHHAVNESDGGTVAAGEKINGVSVDVSFPGSNQSSNPLPIGRYSAYYNYFLGSDASRWVSHANAYEGVLYPDFYPGIDLKIYSQQHNLKYDFIVAPNADPARISMIYSGAETVTLLQGDVHVKTSIATIIEKSPVAFQFIEGRKVWVKCEYDFTGDTISFCFPDSYDPCSALVIDPLLIFSTYSGSTADNWGSTATPGEEGNLYSAGVTLVVDNQSFPATAGAFQVDYTGLWDVGILKYDSVGQNLLYASYLGGSLSESAHSLIMNADEELIVLGTTSSADFPTTAGAFDRSFNGGTPVSHVVAYGSGSDIFISRISADGSRLLASTFLGGNKNDGLNPTVGLLTRNYGDELRGDIITDAAGNIFVSTVTASADFPAVTSFDTDYNGGATDALVFKIDKNLSHLRWAAFLGGDNADASHTIKLEPSGGILVAGGTGSEDFPVTPGVYQTALAGDADGWIARISANGMAIQKATFTGTADYDQVYFLDVNETGDIYVYGQTSGDFRVTAGVFSNPGSGQFVQSFKPDFSALHFSTVFGSGRGFPDISPTAFMVNECGNIYMAGWGGLINQTRGHWPGTSRGLPVSGDAIQSSTSGSDFYFVALSQDGSEFYYGTYLGGTQSRTHVDGGTSRFSKKGIVYHAVCSGCKITNTSLPTSDFPTTPGAWSRNNNSPNCNNAAFKLDLSLLKARLQTNSLSFDNPGMNNVCIPDKVVFQNRSSGGEVFQWDFGDGTTMEKPDTSFIVHQYKAPGTYTVWLKATDKGTCQVKDSAMTKVNVYLAQSEVQDDDDLCSGTLYQLQASGGLHYHWTSDDNIFQSDDQNPAVRPQDTTRYYVRITESTGCWRDDTVQLNVVQEIDPAFEIIRESDCTSLPRILVKNTTDSLYADDIVFFDFGDGTTSDRGELSHQYEQEGVYQLKLVTARAMCVTEKTVPVAAYRLSVPNVITPGSHDGKNDTFIVRFSESDDITPDDLGMGISVVIYNRWGREVYASPDYQHDWSAEGLPSGTYFYEVTVAGHATCRSWVQVIK